ncbi:hypothetical protein FN976_14730 [Caenimonas sedimenti]|uniref:Uncharacterized protein n=1 Tax=Caenimonas sedimenti TaxID=2596921 RepID=A0A562ZR17_9BURK|nr:hypothetical protein [Caenimonas sedimenti]TWO70796.1 hypothetical protein FN976_14730 [Caenimonas sedimenti]
MKGTQLTFAVRGGAKQWALVALGSALVCGGLYGIYWLFEGSGELTVAGYIFLLVPAAVAVFGVYVLDIALMARTTYVLGARTLTHARESLFQRKRTEIARDTVTAITQQYSPPGDSHPAGHPGDWTTFVVYTLPGERKVRELAIDGLNSQAEARWLGPLLAKWAEVKMKRGFGPAFEEADAAGLPDLSSPAAEDR